MTMTSRLSNSLRHPRVLSRCAFIIFGLVALTGCPNKRPGKTAVFANRPSSQPSSRPSKKPSSQPARGPFQGPKKASETGQDLPLSLKGHNSVAQLNIEAAEISGSAKANFEKAYRLVFCSKRNLRNPNQARELLNQVMSKHPKFGPAYRAMAYTYIDQGFQIAKAIQWYQRGVEAAPGYGLNYYALAFSLAGAQRLEDGFAAFQKAMSLGVKDERNLRQRFFANMNKGIRTH